MSTEMMNQDIQELAKQSNEQIEMAIASMTSLMRDTDCKVESLEKQGWFKRMWRTVTGKNKATKLEIQQNHDKLNAYMSKAIAALYEQGRIRDQVIMSLGNQLNELYVEHVQLKQMLGAFVTKLNEKIDSVDNFHMLQTEIDQGVYSDDAPIIAICKVMSQFDNRILDDPRKLDIFTRSLQNQNILNDQPRLLTDYLQDMAGLSVEQAGAIHLELGSLHTNFMANALRSLLEEYQFLPSLERRMKDPNLLIEDIMQQGRFDHSVTITITEIYDDFLQNKIDARIRLVTPVEPVVDMVAVDKTIDNPNAKIIVTGLPVLSRHTLQIDDIGAFIDDIYTYLMNNVNIPNQDDKYLLVGALYRSVNKNIIRLMSNIDGEPFDELCAAKCVIANSKLRDAINALGFKQSLDEFDDILWQNRDKLHSFIVENRKYIDDIMFDYVNKNVIFSDNIYEFIPKVFTLIAVGWLMHLVNYSIDYNVLLAGNENSKFYYEELLCNSKYKNNVDEYFLGDYLDFSVQLQRLYDLILDEYWGYVPNRLESTVELLEYLKKEHLDNGKIQKYLDYDYSIFRGFDKVLKHKRVYTRKNSHLIDKAVELYNELFANKLSDNVSEGVKRILKTLDDNQYRADYWEEFAEENRKAFGEAVDEMLGSMQDMFMDSIGVKRNN